MDDHTIRQHVQIAKLELGWSTPALVLAITLWPQASAHAEHRSSLTSGVEKD